jgi:hypothetical protein
MMECLRDMGRRMMVSGCEGMVIEKAKKLCAEMHSLAKVGEGSPLYAAGEELKKAVKQLEYFEAE